MKLKKLIFIASMCAMLGASVTAYATEENTNLLVGSVQNSNNVIGELAVANFRQIKATDTSVTFEWMNTSLNYTDHEIMVSEDPKEKFNSAGKVEKYGSSFTVTGLKPSTTYYVKIVSSMVDADSINGIAQAVTSSAFEVVTSTSAVTGFRQSNATANKVTFTWNKVDRAEEYKLYTCGDNYIDKLLKTVKGNKVTINYADINNYVVIKSCSTGKYFKSEFGDKLLYKSKIVTKPATYSIKDLEHDFYMDGSMWLSLGYKENIDGYNIEVYDYNNKLLTKLDSTTGSSTISLSKVKDKFCKIRVRAFNKMHTGKKIYGGWSTYRYAAPNPLNRNSINKFTTSGNNAVLKWDKVKGATSYTIYVGKDLKPEAFKKLCNTKNLSYTTKLSNVKGKYLYIVANRKVSSKLVYKSDRLIYKIY